MKGTEIEYVLIEFVCIVYAPCHIVFKEFTRENDQFRTD